MERIKKLEEQLTLVATEVGIEVVKEVAKAALIQKPNLKLKHFIEGLDKYVEEAKNKANN